MHNAPFRIPADLLDRYFTGHCTPDEIVQVEAALAQNSDLFALRQEIEGGPVDVNAGWTRFAASMWLRDLHAQLDQSDQKDAIPVRSSTNKMPMARRTRSSSDDSRQTVGTLRWTGEGMRGNQRMLRRIVPYALASLIVGVIGLMFGRYARLSGHSAYQDTSPIMYTTGKGQRANITLSDGSTVALNVDSRLEVPADYSHGNRTLRLTGEALFSVAHRSRSSFTVQSGGVPMHVLGTQFLVRHYPTDSATTVAVRDGKVGVHVRTHTFVLSAGQESDVTTRGATPIHAVTSAQFTFATGVLTLEDMPLRDAVVELGRWYNLDIRLGDPRLATQKVWGGFAAGTQSEMNTIFERAMDLRVVRDGRTITLFPKGNL
jgi:ferric-dicitrate binding protein FerR (iron transport regulator)